jgi:hypothetical protein
MRKTMVYLHEDEAEGLRVLSGTTGESQAELIRGGVRRLLREGEGSGESRPRWNPDAVHEKTLGRY